MSGRLSDARLTGSTAVRMSMSFHSPSPIFHASAAAMLLARFWAVNTNGGPAPDLEGYRRHARFLAKRGVNMVRWHGSLNPKGDRAKSTDVDLDEIEKVRRFVAAMKAEGIYTTFSPYWAVAVHAKPEWGLKGHPS